MSPPDLTYYYPLNVIYPHGGEVYLLVWRTNREGYALQSLVVAKSPKSALHAWKDVLAVNPRSVVSSFQCVDLVAPPQWMREAHARLWDSAHQNQFEHWVGGIVRGSKELPNGLTHCPACVGNIGYRPWCGDCVLGVLVEGESWSQFYWRHRDTFRKAHPPQPAEMALVPTTSVRVMGSWSSPESMALHHLMDSGFTSIFGSHPRPNFPSKPTRGGVWMMRYGSVRNCYRVTLTAQPKGGADTLGWRSSQRSWLNGRK